MSQSYYTASNAYSNTRLQADKLNKVDSLSNRIKARESQPPMLNNDKKPFADIAKFSKEKDPTLKQPYSPHTNFSNSYRAGDRGDTAGNISGNTSMQPTKNYVTPYSQFPQTSIQPRLSKTIPYDDDQGKKPAETGSGTSYTTFKEYTKPETHGRKLVSPYEGIKGVSTPNSEETTRRAPRFSQPAMFMHEDTSQKFSKPNPSPIKSNYTTSGISQTSSTSHIKSNLSQKYNPPSKLSAQYHHSSSGTSSSGLSSLHSIQKKAEFRITDFVKGMELGNGKFGKVYVARHKLTGFICAVKEISKSIIVEENIINQFIRELKIQSCLDHPNIVKLYGFFHDKSNIYLLLELGSQGQLYKVIKEKRKLSEATVSFIIRQLCEAVKYLHGLNIIHRDIKPENIVLQYGTVKICDFGWSVCRSGELRSTFCGTPLYVSPEILKGELYDEKIDIWALGILTYELLVGDTPFQIFSQEELVKIIKQDITFPADVEVSAPAKDFILKILKKNPDERMKVAKVIEHPFLTKAVEVFDLDI